MTKGEEVRVIESYDLFGLDVENLVGIYIKKTSLGKHLVFFRENGEWAELREEQFERISPDKIPRPNLDFAKSVRELGK